MQCTWFRGSCREGWEATRVLSVTSPRKCLTTFALASPAAVEEGKHASYQLGRTSSQNEAISDPGLRPMQWGQHLTFLSSRSKYNSLSYPSMSANVLIFHVTVARHFRIALVNKNRCSMCNMRLPGRLRRPAIATRTRM